MAPPTLKPRLATVDVERVALQTARLVVDRIDALVVDCLHPSYQLETFRGRLVGDDLIRAAPVYKAVVAIAEFAKLGIALPESLDAVVDRLRLVEDVMDETRDDEPATELAVIVDAARARAWLDQGIAVGIRDVAILASMSTRQVRELVAAGTLGQARAVDVVRFLASRDVPGFRPAKTTTTKKRESKR